MSDNSDNSINSKVPNDIYMIGRNSFKKEVLKALELYNFDDIEFEDVREGIVKAINIVNAIKI